MKNFYPATKGNWVSSLFYPPKCLCCELRVPPNKLFCRACGEKLPDEPQRRMLHLRNGLDVPVLAPMLYTGGYRETLLLYKFENYMILTLRIGMLMAWLVEELPKWDWLVTFVPLSRDGLQERGYDQSELLAYQVARQNHFDVQRLIDKVKKTGIQHELGLEERLTNPLGAYKARKKAAGKNILLVDDIVTTGSTLKECASVLFEAGARSVCCLCAAKSSGQDEGLSEIQEAGRVWGWI